MSRISGKDTKMEVLVRKYLFCHGFRFRKNDRNLCGTPDIVLPKYKAIVLVHGCFWHGHKGCKASKLPGSRRSFWEKKISDNIERDKDNIGLLEDSGWRVILIWQCELNNKLRQRERLSSLINEVKGV